MRKASLPATPTMNADTRWSCSAAMRVMRRTAGMS